ncbi:MAG: hypothetical protein AAFN92_15210, partial [Bacteroidota bacterium]
MRAYLLTLLLVLCLAPASAQKDPSPDSLAEAFCQCMQATEALPPRGQATDGGATQPCAGIPRL